VPRYLFSSSATQASEAQLSYPEKRRIPRCVHQAFRRKRRKRPGAGDFEKSRRTVRFRTAAAPISIPYLFPNFSK
jgi:hypothetical protein